MPKEIMIKITSDEVMELKMIRDQLARGLEVQNRRPPHSVVKVQSG